MGRFKIHLTRFDNIILSSVYNMYCKITIAVTFIKIRAVLRESNELNMSVTKWKYILYLINIYCAHDIKYLFSILFIRLIRHYHHHCNYWISNIVSAYSVNVIYIH